MDTERVPCRTMTRVKLDFLLDDSEIKFATHQFGIYLGTRNVRAGGDERQQAVRGNAGRDCDEIPVRIVCVYYAVVQAEVLGEHVL